MSATTTTGAAVRRETKTRIRRAKRKVERARELERAGWVELAAVLKDARAEEPRPSMRDLADIADVSHEAVSRLVKWDPSKGGNPWR